jgi:hypothetical protein
MRHASRSLWFAGLILLGGTLGCSVFEQHKSRCLCHGQLPGDRIVTLEEYTTGNAALDGPQYNLARLNVMVYPRSSQPVCNGRVCKPPLDARSGTIERGFARWDDVKPFSLGPVEGRSDPGGERVWFVDLDAHRVAVSFDSRTNQITGPADAAPEWAMVEGGVSLKPIKPCHLTVPAQAAEYLAA